MTNRGSEFDTTAPEFKVVASGDNIVYRWLNLMQEASGLPTTNPDSDAFRLRLSNTTLSNSLLRGIVSGISSQGNLYTLNATFQFKEDDAEQSAFEFIIPGRPSGRRFRPPRSFVDLMTTRMPMPTTPISSSELHIALSKRLNDDEFTVSLDQDEDLIAIEAQKDPTLNQITSYVQISYDPSAGALCSLFMESELDPTIQAFERKYQTFAVLTKHVLDAIYQTKGEAPPGRTIKIEPPRDTEAQIKRSESIIKMHKKQLDAAGLGGDGEMDKEIDAKIVFEGKPSETFDDVGGQQKAKDELQTLAYSLKDPEIFRRWGTYPPRRILMHGPPGTGKTLLARALANSAEAGIFVVEIADIVHSLYGRSERFIQRVFDRAREQTPVILFFDELDALATHRQNADNVTSRIVNVFLTNLDGMRDREDNIMVVGSTNRLEAIDRALLRAGRFDVLVEVPLPDVADREEILKIHMGKAINRAGGRRLFSEDFDLKELVKATPSFSGADIMEVVRRALNKKVRSELEGQTVKFLTTDEVIEEIKNYESVRIAKGRVGFSIPQ